MSKKILILLGHPLKDSLNGALLDAYEAGAREAGHEVRRVNIGDLAFDPILHKAYREIQPLEPDLIALKESFNWAEHIVISYPTWWSSMPALLKGLFDRLWIPGFAYNFHKEGSFLKRKFSWIARLKGRSARIFITSDTHPFFLWFLYGDTSRILADAILGFSGVKSRVTKFGSVKWSGEARKKSWIEKARRFGVSGR